MTARQIDTNGWIEVKGNPLSRVGVFQYSGSQVGGDENRIYNVYRPEEELSDPETIESFKLIPWINDHLMLGKDENGLTPAEEKGVEGVIGEDVYFKDGILYGNIKVFSESLADLIEAGKEQLSAGYRCVYKFVKGVFNGQPYDAIQTQIRGNHLALVDEGRMGKEVAVLDRVFTYDAIDKIDIKEFQMSKELQEAKAAFDAKEADLKAQLKAALDENEELKKEKEEEKKAEDADETESEKKAEEEKKAEDADEEEKKEEKKDGMDAAAFDAKLESFKKTILLEAKQRDALAEKISTVVGTFDATDKTLDEVAAYGAEKLGLKCPKGTEKVALDAYFHNRTTTKAEFALDSSFARTGRDESLAKFLNENSI